jgi:hypothetical protein
VKLAARIVQNAIRLLWIANFILGFQFWMGRATSMIPVHMRIGETLVLLLWILAGIGIKAGVRLPFALGVIAYGFFVVGFGMTMGGMLPGGAHEIVRVLHLLIGVAAIGAAEVVGGKIKRA